MNEMHALLSEPGIIEFTNPSFLFKESAGKALITLRRFNGADGVVGVSWKTEDMTAVSGRDYMGGEGVVEFEHGECQKTIEIFLNDDQVSISSSKKGSVSFVTCLLLRVVSDQISLFELNNVEISCC